MSTTPLLKQYFTIKEQYPHALVFFQVGDFYELFFEDAQKASAFLGIALTKRGYHNEIPVPLCGVPVHALDHYLIKLVKGGFHVVICDQLEAARPGKLVERGIKQVLTPGTLTDVKLLSEKTASYCAALALVGQTYGLVFVELLTGHIFATALSADSETLLDAELCRFAPDEVVLDADDQFKKLQVELQRKGYVTSVHSGKECDDTWLCHGAGPAYTLVTSSPAVMAALGIMYGYLKKNQPHALDHCRHIFMYSPEDFLVLDAITQRNLDLVKNSYDGGSQHTLFSLLDHAATPMGSRVIKKWLLRPLINKQAIEQRLDAVELFFNAVLLREQLIGILKPVGDIERVVGRILLQRAALGDYKALLTTLRQLPAILKLLGVCPPLPLMERIAQGLGDFSSLAALLDAALYEEAELDWLIKTGYNAELDKLRQLVDQVAHAIASFEEQEQKRTGINSLKIRLSNQGYAFEVTKTHADGVPDDYVRIQSLTNRERFTNQALKDLEYDIMRAERDVKELERFLYQEVCAQVHGYAVSLKKMTHSLGQLDALVALSSVASQERYVRPVFHENSHEQRDIIVMQGRHPVVSALLKHVFVANDTTMTDDKRTWIITGPNMGGKSTYLRQITLICIMAQMGSFVPAQSAQLPLLDRIFTRIGASDNVAKGESTFLVEMKETALICNQATANSLIVLDEVGRGTSTYDGLAIAQAVLEYVHQTIGARTLFATHYHELTGLAEQHRGIAVYHAASKKTAQGIVLLHSIVAGVADGSFGLEVAKNAQLPYMIIERAEHILLRLQEKERELAQLTLSTDAQALNERMGWYAARVAALEKELIDTKKILERLESVDYDNLSPKQAFDVLWQLKR